MRSRRHALANLRLGIRQADTGFTLLELLVALALVALLVTGLPNLLSLQEHATSNADLIKHDEETLGALSFLERHVSAALAITRKPGGGIEPAAFRGDAHSLQFVAPAAVGGLYGQFQLRLRFSSERQDGRLVLDLDPLSPASPFDAAHWRTKDRILLNHLSDFSMRYFGYDPLTQQVGWQDSWSEANGLPRLVEFTMSQSGRSEPITRRLVVELQLRDTSVLRRRSDYQK